MTKWLSFGIVPWKALCGKRQSCLRYTTRSHVCFSRVSKLVVCQQPSCSNSSRSLVHTDKLKSTSSLVGYVIVFCSTFYKVPQIARIVKKKSSKGISLSMYVLETIGIYLSLCYCIQAKFPWETFAESFCIFLQNVVIILFLYKYKERKDIWSSNWIYALPLLLIVLLFCFSLPLRWLQLLQVCSSPLMNVSKIPQILENERSKSTGELSPVTLSFQLAGNIARVFTTMVQLQSRWFLTSVFISLVLNALLGWQYLRYRFWATDKSIYFPDDRV